jgi:hypothetical protein
VKCISAYSSEMINHPKIREENSPSFPTVRAKTPASVCLGNDTKMDESKELVSSGHIL